MDPSRVQRFPDSGDARLRRPDDTDVELLPSRPGSQVLDPEVLRVIIAGAVRLYREGLALSLADRGGFEVVATVADAARVLAAVREHRPDIVLLDISLPDGHTLVRELSTAEPGVKVVAFAVSETANEVLACAEAGIAGYVPADGSVDDLAYSLRRAARGEIRVPPRIAGVMFQRLAALARPSTQADLGAELTPRELEILELIGDGLPNKQIARRLSIRLATVKNHVHHILEKLGVATRGEAAARLRSDRRLGLS